jgi:hypothetical protein
MPQLTQAVAAVVDMMVMAAGTAVPVIAYYGG